VTPHEGTSSEASTTLSDGRAAYAEPRPAASHRRGRHVEAICKRLQAGPRTPDSPGVQAPIGHPRRAPGAAIPDGASRARTDDLHAASVALSQLSYGPEPEHDSAPKGPLSGFRRRRGGYARRHGDAGAEEPREPRARACDEAPLRRLRRDPRVPGELGVPVVPGHEVRAHTLAAVLPRRPPRMTPSVDPQPETRRRARVQGPAVGFLGGLLLFAALLAVVALVLWWALL
jgi:hypothetical protein